MSDLAARRSAFRRLHDQGCFVAPNPWDRGSALLLEGLGFKALASTSAGFAFSRGLPDEVKALSRDLVLEHLRDLVAATTLPVHADFQNGYADDAAGVTTNVKLCVETGVAGLSIEDATGNPTYPLFDFEVAVERVRAARAALDALSADVLLTARSECHLVGHPRPFEESIKRLQAFAEAGADVLYAPGLRERTAIRTVVQALSPKPVNILLVAGMGLSVSDLAELGVRRVSVGSGLARVAWSAFLKSARALAQHGDASSFEGITSVGELSELFSDR
jgi:2-methylisocitrate lyase-like PEP mutase family enzyme